MLNRERTKVVISNSSIDTAEKKRFLKDLKKKNTTKNKLVDSTCQRCTDPQNNTSECSFTTKDKIVSEVENSGKRITVQQLQMVRHSSTQRDIQCREKEEWGKLRKQQRVNEKY